ncbi:ParB/RepB/Spo0J family partition protein [Aporhodopirellula aestuarii]|uniref:ParB/RepB/Spo0J family partition protein n=1 Tax=Aporhodopirellula aestuarii TaxID=2950107 RepID=A0ABT0UCE6_9BACT|nr:ParB/RepB/Spo0J family partition protein [Aporhodopirellula aestuarii]MCM2374698.1 ParB/RepB/Spo0J family partition protein [Aporhodopirellula aestuarii]
MEGRRRLHGAFAIDITLIEPDPNQPRKRIDPNHLTELTQSLKRHGVLQPISVRLIKETGRYRIVAGECRYTAAREAGLSDLPCWLKSPKENEVLVEQIVENWVRSDLNPFELADSLAILRDANGYTQKMLAEETGKSPGEISKLLSILGLNPDVQSLARRDETGRISKRHLYSISRLPAPMQSVVLEKVQTQNLTAVDVERIAERLSRQQETGDRRGQPKFRRAFKVSQGTVTFSFHSDSVSDKDLLHALHQVRQQLGED